MLHECPRKIHTHTFSLVHVPGTRSCTQYIIFFFDQVHKISVYFFGPQQVPRYTHQKCCRVTRVQMCITRSLTQAATQHITRSFYLLWIIEGQNANTPRPCSCTTAMSATPHSITLYHYAVWCVRVFTVVL